MEEEKREKNEGKSQLSPNLKKGVRFTKDHQPSPKAKSKGWEKWRTLKTFNEDLRATMCEVTTASGEKVNFFEWMANKLQRNIITNKDKKEMSLKDENSIMMEIIKFFKQDEKKIELDTTQPINIIIQKEDADL